MTTPSVTAQGSEPLDLTLKMITQLCAAPSWTEVAGELLSESLQQMYPDLHINPDTTLMGTPVWELVDDQIVSRPTRYETLSSLLATQTFMETPTLCIEGEHFLTQLPVTEPALHLPVRIVEVANTINLLAPVLLEAVREKLVDFWNHDNGARWHELSNTLRKVWNVQRVEGWSEEDCKLARDLYLAPDTTDLKAEAQRQWRAYLVDVDLVSSDKVTHTHEIAIAVLIGQSDGNTVILCHSFEGYRKFSNLQQLGEYLPTLRVLPGRHERLEWRLYEPGGNFFDIQACTLIALQIDLAAATYPSVMGLPSEAPSGTVAGTHAKATPQGPQLDWYRQALPDWLAPASGTDLTCYSRHLKDLAALHSLNAGKTYQDDIPTIRQYALDTLKAQIIKDHPDAANLALDTLTLKVRSQVVWGLFPVPGQVETHTFSLADLALQNLIALPLGNKSLQMQTRSVLPVWLTVAYVEQLITQVNVGNNYPALIRSKLMDDPAEALRRKTLYTEHLRIQLPMLALQHKIRGEAGIDERGYRYVSAVMQADSSDHCVDGQAIVIRHLGFVPKRRQTNGQDVVSNMYVIGPRSVDAGPCLLYRPLFEPVLLQYPSQANLLYAIAQSHTLRESVLAWLPDAARRDYSNYVFPGPLPSPWAVADLLVEPNKIWTFSGPMSLGEQALNGDLFTTLFDANAKALVQLADRQSVSNAENRWATLKQAGWLIFNAALPFMGRIAGTGAWIWQIVDQVQTLVEAREQGDQPAQWSALTDVLLNLGMAITLHVASRHGAEQPASIEPEKTEPTKVEPETKPSAIVVKQLPDRTTGPLPSGHELPLSTSGAIPRSPDSMVKVLDSFKTDKPAALAAAISEAGAHQYLYRDGQRYYAPVHERWFEVELDDDTVFIIDPKTPGRRGPAMLHNAQGKWFVDVRLRLRGGGRKQKLQSAKAKAEGNAAALKTQVDTFERAKTSAQRELQQAHEAITEAPGTSTEAKRRAYLEKLDNQSSSYEEVRQQLARSNVFSQTPEFQRKALGYLQAQLDLNQAGIRELQTTFTPKLQTVLKQLETPAAALQESHVEDARQVSTMSDDMIKRLDYAQSRFTELRQLARDGLDLIRTSKSQLPAYASDDLLALQVTLERNLCLEPQSITTAPEAWTRIGEIVDSADLAVQATREALDERSESRLDERIDSLSSLVDQFQYIDERLQDFVQDTPAQTLSPDLDRLRKRVRAFADRAIAELAPLHAEQKDRRIRPTPPPTPPRPIKRFIRTRYNGVLIGEQRLTPIGLETHLVDVKSPMTGKTIATFHEKTPGVWVEHIEATTTRPATPAITVQASQAHGQSLLDQLPAFQTRADAQVNKPSRTPIGIEHMFHQHARLLDQAVQTIEEALTQSNITESDRRSAAALGKKLNDAAQSLYQQARQHVQRLITQQPPTMAGFEWLNNRNVISIKKTVTRRRLESDTKDYLDEYTITDQSTRAPLWYAHFHYSTSDARFDRFLSARLKTPAEHVRGIAADSAKGLNAQQQIAFYRSGINLAQGRQFFFPQERH